MFNSIKILDKAFDYIYEEEKKLNYEYDPRNNNKEDDTWKRHLFFFELKKDFIKDVGEFGFCPYIKQPYDEQRKDKKILKYLKPGNVSRTDYIKNLYKKITINNINKKNQKSLSSKRIRYTLAKKNKNKSAKVINYNKLNNRNTFLSSIYNKINKTKKENNNLKLNKDLNNINLKSNIENNDNITYRKNKNEDKQNKSDSFIYEPEKNNPKYNNYYYKSNKGKYENTNIKDESSSSDSTNNKNAKKVIFLNDKNNSNAEFNKKGWRMTTSLDAANYFKNMKGLIEISKNLKNNGDIPIHLSDKKNNNNKSRKYTLRKSISNYSINRDSKGDIIYNYSLNKMMNKKITKKSNDKIYKLFLNIKRIKKEKENKK